MAMVTAACWTSVSNEEEKMIALVQGKAPPANGLIETSILHAFIHVHAVSYILRVITFITTLNRFN